MINSFSGKYSFLSNFYPVPGGLVYLDNKFPSVENAYQSAKCPLELRSEKWKELLTCSSSRAKHIGKTLPLKDGWETEKLIIMLNLLITKFSEPSLEKMLLDTGDEELIEGNWWKDTYWGVCDGKGKNMLGNLLMQIRLQKKMFK